MKRLYVLLLQIGFVLMCNAQSYVINHYQSTYDTLVNYTSATLEVVSGGGDPYYWEKSFDFGFDFPFYGETYTEVNMDTDGVGYFPGAANYSLFLFAGGYTIAEPTSSTFLFSEVRYAHQMVDNLDALVIEFHEVYLDYEYELNGANHVINFQMWFWENGIIEVHHGEIDLANCTHYFPGQGFSFDNQDPTGEIFGPFISINDTAINEAACFFGDHANPMTIFDDDDNCGVVTSIPPEGFVVQFSPTTISSIDDFQSGSGCNFGIAQENGMVRILGEPGSFQSCEIYDYVGRKIGSSDQAEFQIDADSPQIIILQIEGRCGRETHKVMVGR